MQKAELQQIIREELEAVIDEKRKKRKAKKKKAKRDACYYKVKARYSVWPSAYASGALVRCRRVGAANWGNKSKKKNENIEPDSKQDNVIQEAVKKVVAEKKSLKNGQSRKDQNEQKAAPTQKASP
tara:strand:- start:233 stop:610 length:378 start_codon:yes stop_codon:yes gene_type:complete